MKLSLSRSPTLRDYFLTASLFKVLEINPRYTRDRKYVHSVVYLLRERVDFSYWFMHTTNGVWSPPLEKVVEDLRLVTIDYGLRLPEEVVEFAKKIKNNFTKEETVDLAKLVAQEKGEALYFFPLKRKERELLNKFLQRTSQAIEVIA